MLGARAGRRDVTLVGIADPQAQGGGAAISTVSGEARRRRQTSPLETAPAPGFSGAAALDAAGPLRRHGGAEAAGGRGPGGAPRAAVVPAERIRNFLEANYVAPSSGTSPALEAVEGVGDAGDLRRGSSVW